MRLANGLYSAPGCGTLLSKLRLTKPIVLRGVISVRSAPILNSSIGRIDAKKNSFIAFSISKKECGSSVSRNKLRRRLRSVARQLITESTSDYASKCYLQKGRIYLISAYNGSIDMQHTKLLEHVKRAINSLHKE